MIYRKTRSHKSWVREDGRKRLPGIAYPGNVCLPAVREPSGEHTNKDTGGADMFLSLPRPHPMLPQPGDLSFVARRMSDGRCGLGRRWRNRKTESIRCLSCQNAELARKENEAWARSLHANQDLPI